MSMYLTEEEQLEAIRTFFKTYGRLIAWIVFAIVLVAGGLRYWQVYHEHKLARASKIYESLMNAVSEDNHAEIHAYVLRLILSYRHTVYAEMAQLLLAKSLVSDAQMPQAKAALDWVMTHAKTKAYRQIARIRLARLYMNEENNEKALSLLEVVNDSAYDAVVLELKGDLYAKKGMKQEAIQAYQLAQSIGKQKGLNQNILGIKLTQLGG